MIQLVTDIGLSLLLVTVIIVCVMVYRRLAIIKAGQEEMASLLDNLDASISRAEGCITSLRQAGKDVEEAVAGEIRRGRSLADELALITEAGNNLADRIEKGVTGARRASKSSPAKGGSAAAADGTAGAGAPPEQQSKILKAIKQAR